MDPKIVNKLEHELEKSSADAIVKRLELAHMPNQACVGEKVLMAKIRVIGVMNCYHALNDINFGGGKKHYG